MKPEDIISTIESPQWSALLLWHLISGAQCYSVGLRPELLFLGLPIITDKGFKEKLVRANKNSTMSSLFNGRELSTSFATLPDRVEHYKDATRSGIIYLGSMVEVEFSDHLSVRPVISWDKEAIKVRKDYFRAAYYLGGILSKENHLAVISRFIGVRNENCLK